MLKDNALHILRADQHNFPVIKRKGGFYLEYETLEYDSMEYKTFLELIRQEIQPQIGSGGVVQLNRTSKNNSTQKDSISILFTGENVSPAIYLDYFYERYREAVPIDQIAGQILVCYCHA